MKKKNRDDYVAFVGRKPVNTREQVPRDHSLEKTLVSIWGFKELLVAIYGTPKKGVYVAIDRKEFVSAIQTIQKRLMTEDPPPWYRRGIRFLQAVVDHRVRSGKLILPGHFVKDIVKAAAAPVMADVPFSGPRTFDERELVAQEAKKRVAVKKFDPGAIRAYHTRNNRHAPKVNLKKVKPNADHQADH